MKPKIMVTGSKGYVAANLIPVLQKSFRVVSYDIKDGFDILSGEKLIRKMRGCKLVYNLAAVSGVKQCAEDPSTADAVNLWGAENVVKCAAQQCAKPILFSSQAAVSNPTSVYGHTKLMLENAFVSTVTILRPSNIYGGRQFSKKQTVVSYFLKANPIILNEHKKEVRDFIHISKVVDACLNAQTYGVGVYDVKSGDSLKIETLAHIIGEARHVKVIEERHSAVRKTIFT